MAYSAILGQKPEIPDPAPPTAAQVSYSNASTSDIIGSNNVQGALDNLAVYSRNLFTSVSNGKNQIASAITGKGVSASGSESFASLAGKIGQIQTGYEMDWVYVYAQWQPNSVRPNTQYGYLIATLPRVIKTPKYVLVLTLPQTDVQSEIGASNPSGSVSSAIYTYNESTGKYDGVYTRRLSPVDSYLTNGEFVISGSNSIFRDVQYFDNSHGQYWAGTNGVLRYSGPYRVYFLY